MLWLAAGPLLLPLLHAPTLQAQARPAAIVGRLVNRETRAPVEGARVSLSATRAAAVADAEGRFRLGNLRPGVFTMQVRAIGYHTGSWLVQVTAGDTLEHDFEMEPRPVELGEVVVEAEPDENWRSPAAFERRRLLGAGHFITQEEIDSRRPRTLSDLLRTVPGVQTSCTARGCSIRMGRSTRLCTPEYFLDGFPATFATGPDFPAQSIAGVEVYGNPVDVPVEFQRISLRCGVIAIWSRSHR